MKRLILTGLLLFQGLATVVNRVQTGQLQRLQTKLTGAALVE